MWEALCELLTYLWIQGPQLAVALIVSPKSEIQAWLLQSQQEVQLIKSRMAGMLPMNFNKGMLEETGLRY